MIEIRPATDAREAGLDSRAALATARGFAK